MHLPYVERIAVLDDMRVVIAVSEPTGSGQPEDEDQEYQHALLVWNVRNNRIERRVE